MIDCCYTLSFMPTVAYAECQYAECRYAECCGAHNHMYLFYLFARIKRCSCSQKSEIYFWVKNKIKNGKILFSNNSTCLQISSKGMPRCQCNKTFFFVTDAPSMSCPGQPLQPCLMFSVKASEYLLLANVRLDSKGSLGTNTLTYLSGVSLTNGKRRFKTSTIGVHALKRFSL